MTAPKNVNGMTGERLERMCSGKHRWADELAARAGAIQSLEARPEGRKLYTYKCPVCQGYHLTKKWSSEKGDAVTIDRVEK